MMDMMQSLKHWLRTGMDLFNETGRGGRDIYGQRTRLEKTQRFFSFSSRSIRVRSFLLFCSLVSVVVVVKKTVCYGGIMCYGLYTGHGVDC